MKKLLCVVFCMMMVMLAVTPAMAAPKQVSAEGLYALVDDANARIDALVAYAIATPENDVKWLQQQIKKIVHNVDSYAKKLGATVQCEMVSYFIDGEWVLIDPLYVVNIRQ